MTKKIVKIIYFLVFLLLRFLDFVFNKKFSYVFKDFVNENSYESLSIHNKKVFFFIPNSFTKYRLVNFFNKEPDTLNWIDSFKRKSISFDGYAMGGLAVGETQDEMFGILNKTVSYMPKNKPRYLMGVGTPSDILGAVKSGIDMFDCVLPTRSGRTALAFTWQGRVNLRNAKYQNDKEPLDKQVSIRNLNSYSKSYLNHLIKTNEILASMLISLHNINFYQQLMSEIRRQIKSGNFNTFYNKYIGLL